MQNYKKISFLFEDKEDILTKLSLKILASEFEIEDIEVVQRSIKKYLKKVVESFLEQWTCRTLPYHKNILKWNQIFKTFKVSHKRTSLVRELSYFCLINKRLPRTDNYLIDLSLALSLNHFISISFYDLSSFRENKIQIRYANNDIFYSTKKEKFIAKKEDIVISGDQNDEVLSWLFNKQDYNHQPTLKTTKILLIATLLDQDSQKIKDLLDDLLEIEGLKLISRELFLCR